MACSLVTIDQQIQTNEISKEEYQGRKNAVPPSEGYASISGYSDYTGVDSVYTSTGYPFTYDKDSKVLTSGNAKIHGSFSELLINVIGSGSLTFSYNCLNTHTAPHYDYFVVMVGKSTSTLLGKSSEEIAKEATFYTNQVSSFSNYSLNIETANETDVTTIYVGYIKDGARSWGDDKVNVKNISFLNTSSLVTVDVTSSNNEYGTVSGGGQFNVNDEVTINAIPTQYGKFYCWVLDGVKTTYTQQYTFSAFGDAQLIAVFGPKDQGVFQNVKTGFVYNSLQTAINASNNEEAVMLVGDTSINENVIIPAGKLVYIPFSSDFVSDGCMDGDSSCSRNSFSPLTNAYSTLTIPSGYSINVQGKLAVGGVIGYPSQGYQGHTSGSFGRIINNGEINVNGGEINCYGFIDGTGIVNATNEGNVYEPFVVYDFAGGSNTAQLFFINQNSFTQYTMQNIRCDLKVNYGSHLYAYCNLYASSEFNKTVSIIVGKYTEKESTLFALDEGAYFYRSIDQSKSISNATEVSGNYGADIYKSIYTIYGGCSLNNLSMQVSGVSVSVKNFPVPYCLDITIENGDYTIDGGWMLYPGSRFEVAEDATLNLNGRFYALEGLYSTGMSEKFYPNANQLQNNGFTAGASFIVNGHFNINNDAIFGGVIQTTSLNSEINVKSGANVTNDCLQVGGTAAYDDNTNKFALNGRIKYRDSLTTLATGKIYRGSSVVSWVKDSYTIDKYVSYKTSTKPTSGEYGTIGSGTNPTYAVYDGPKVIEINETMYGSFTIPDLLITESCFVFKTFYNDSDTSKAVVTDIVSDAFSGSFKISSTTGNENYKHLVEYKVDDGEFISLNAINGVYSITDVNGEVTIRVTSGIKGDVDLSGSLNAADVTLIRRHLAGYTGLTNLKCIFLGDVDGDNKVNAADVTKIRRYLAGYIESL